MEATKTNPKVSIIIPMYKTAPFLEELFDMVCGQTFKDTEIICVLDGPNEEMREIIERRAKEDNRIICLEQEHGGAGKARNTGLDIARGDYLSFLDADDLFAPELIEKLYSIAVDLDAEIAMCSYTRVDYATKEEIKGMGFSFSEFKENTVNNPSAINNLYDSIQVVSHPTWNKLFKKQFVLNRGIRFSETMVQNDAFFTMATITCAERIAVIKEDLLTQRRNINENSITINRAEHSDDTLTIMDQLYTWLNRNGYWEKREEDYCSFVRDAIRYHSEFDYNESLIRGTAKMLCTKQPWKSMCNEELKKTLSLDAETIEKQVIKKADEIKAFEGSDNSKRLIQLTRLGNRHRTYEEIIELMKNEYGRDISKKDSLFPWLKWSVKKRGWKETFRKIREKEEEILIEPIGVICSGHLTNAGHDLAFFIPMEVHHETVEIEDLAVVVRCNGYYPFAVSGENMNKLTQLGFSNTPVISGGTSTRKGEVINVYTQVTPGFGITVEVRFTKSLLKNRNGEKAGNNQPLSVIARGKIILK